MLLDSFITIIMKLLLEMDPSTLEMWILSSQQLPQILLNYQLLKAKYLK